MNTFTKNNLILKFEEPLSFLVGKYTIQDYLDRWETDETEPKAMAESFLTFVESQDHMLGETFEAKVVQKIIDDFAHSRRLRTKQGSLPLERYEWERHFSFSRLEKATEWIKPLPGDATDLLSWAWHEMISGLVSKAVYNNPSRLSIYSPRVLDLLEKVGTRLVANTTVDDFNFFSFEIQTDTEVVTAEFAGFTGEGPTYQVTSFTK